MRRSVYARVERAADDLLFTRDVMVVVVVVWVFGEIVTEIAAKSVAVGGTSVAQAPTRPIFQFFHPHSPFRHAGAPHSSTPRLHV